MTNCHLDGSGDWKSIVVGYLNRTKRIRYGGMSAGICFYCPERYLMVPKPRMKPKFILPLDKDEEIVFECLDEILKSDRYSVNGQVLKKHAFVQLPREKRSFLSPYLNLSLRKDNDSMILVGRFSPHPHVWTGFMVVYSILAFVGLGGFVYGWAQSLIGEPATMMWFAPLSIAVIAFVYGAALIGQGLTADEMYILRNAVDRAVENCDKSSGPAI